MKNILILGGNGYIGNRLYEDYKDFYNISVVDICWHDKPTSNIIIEDYKNLPKDFYDKFDVIILLAAHSSVKMCEGSILSAYNNNVNNFVNLLSKINSNQKFIYASSSSVYGDVGVNCVDEEYKTFLPHNHYDITKHINDLYAPRFGVEFYGLRFGTVNGYSKIVRNDVMINSMVYSGIKNNEIKLYIKDIIRPILGIKDLSRAIKQIIECVEDKRGIYNLASFNSTAENIAKTISNKINVPIKEYPVDPTNITNAKLQTKCYNFSINCDKFKNIFNFNFEETIETITEELKENFDKITFSSRNEFKLYE